MKTSMPSNVISLMTPCLTCLRGMKRFMLDSLLCNETLNSPESPMRVASGLFRMASKCPFPRAPRFSAGALKFGHLWHRKTRLTLTRRFAPPSPTRRGRTVSGGVAHRVKTRELSCPLVSAAEGSENGNLDPKIHSPSILPENSFA